MHNSDQRGTSILEKVAKTVNNRYIEDLNGLYPLLGRNCFSYAANEPEKLKKLYY